MHHPRLSSRGAWMRHHSRYGRQWRRIAGDFCGRRIRWQQPRLRSREIGSTVPARCDATSATFALAAAAATFASPTWYHRLPCTWLRLEWRLLELDVLFVGRWWPMLRHGRRLLWRVHLDQLVAVDQHVHHPRLYSCDTWLWHRGGDLGQWWRLPRDLLWRRIRRQEPWLRSRAVDPPLPT